MAYSDNEFDQVRDAIDGKVYGGLQAAGRGALAVLGSGFGKGLLIAAAIGAAVIVGATLFAPQLLGITGSYGVGKLLELGMQNAANILLGSAPGIALLATGGAAGSLFAAHSENTRIGREGAEAQAAAFAHARQRCEEQGLAPPAELCANAKGGHCAQLMHERLQQNRQERGMAG